MSNKLQDELKDVFQNVDGDSALKMAKNESEIADKKTDNLYEEYLKTDRPHEENEDFKKIRKQLMESKQVSEHTETDETDDTNDTNDLKNTDNHVVNPVDETNINQDESKQQKIDGLIKDVRSKETPKQVVSEQTTDVSDDVTEIYDSLKVYLNFRIGDFDGPKPNGKFKNGFKDLKYSDVEKDDYIALSNYFDTDKFEITDFDTDIDFEPMLDKGVIEFKIVLTPYSFEPNKDVTKSITRTINFVERGNKDHVLEQIVDTHTFHGVYDIQGDVVWDDAEGRSKLPQYMFKMIEADEVSLDGFEPSHNIKGDWVTPNDNDLVKTVECIPLVETDDKTIITNVTKNIHHIWDDGSQDSFNDMELSIPYVDENKEFKTLILKTHIPNGEYVDSYEDGDDIYIVYKKTKDDSELMSEFLETIEQQRYELMEKLSNIQVDDPIYFDFKTVNELLSMYNSDKGRLMDQLNSKFQHRLKYQINDLLSKSNLPLIEKYGKKIDDFTEIVDETDIKSFGYPITVESIADQFLLKCLHDDELLYELIKQKRPFGFAFTSMDVTKGVGLFSKVNIHSYQYSVGYQD